MRGGLGCVLDDDPAVVVGRVKRPDSQLEDLEEVGEVTELVQRLHLRSVLLGEGADHDPIGIDEVVDRAALGKELGVRHITDVRETAGLERSANLLAGPDRNGRLHDEHAPPLDAREVV